MGVNLVAGGATCKVWAPSAQAVYINGTFAGTSLWDTNANPDLQVPIALDAAMHEKVVAAVATLINTVDIRGVNPNPPVVTRIDPNGVAHVQYGFRGPSKKLFVCLGTAHASLHVQFSIDQQLPIREPQN